VLGVDKGDFMASFACDLFVGGGGGRGLGFKLKSCFVDLCAI
jgi:hypothetical protein